eukprot:GHUV01051867.1.p2 GENE.GHUV01051867.1~~GHUV01051867.1.p2  ORF type:complete len:133 (+),score=24.80 GHUV01051867.1:3-401(+)
MFSKITRGISHASGGKKGFKYKITIQVEKLDNLPATVKKCRVVWSRGPKLQMTETKDVVKGECTSCTAWCQMPVVTGKVLVTSDCLLQVLSPFTSSSARLPLCTKTPRTTLNQRYASMQQSRSSQVEPTVTL